MELDSRTLIREELTAGGAAFGEGEHPLIRWRSVIAGFVISTLSLIGFLGFWLTLGQVDQAQGLEDKFLLGAIPILIITFSLFFGGYFASRISRYSSMKVGGAQGVLIASLFIIFFIYQVIALSFWRGKLKTDFDNLNLNILETSYLAEDALLDLDIKGESSLLAYGLMERIIKGDKSSAINYVSLRIGVPEEMASEKVNQLNKNLNAWLESKRSERWQWLKTYGRSLFMIVFFGILAAASGGIIGAATNLRKPIISERIFKYQHA
jgi:hypothetical protein